MPSYDARFVPDSAVANGHVREHCSAHRTRIGSIGAGVGRQVRIERLARGNATPVDLALYTVAEVHDDAPEVVRVGHEAPESEHHDLRDRLGLGSTDPFDGRVNSQVPDPTCTDDDAKPKSEFIERLKDNGRHTGLIVIAPHGGDIEQHTDEQAQHLGNRLSSKCVSVWFCKGFKAGGGALDRWHITSTDLSEDSFPKLKSVFGRRFEYAVAFHGWSHDSICIGGSAPPDLKKQIKAGVVRALTGSGIRVATDDEGTCPSDFNGTSSKNIVNRLGINGVQLEQSNEARERFGPAIADAVADVIGPKINVCTAPVFEASGPAACFLRSIGNGMLVAPLFALAWLPPVPCEIRRRLFRIRNCRRGNSDPCIEL